MKAFSQWDDKPRHNTAINAAGSGKSVRSLWSVILKASVSFFFRLSFISYLLDFLYVSLSFCLAVLRASFNLITALVARRGSCWKETGEVLIGASFWPGERSPGWVWKTRTGPSLSREGGGQAWGGSGPAVINKPGSIQKQPARMNRKLAAEAGHGEKVTERAKGRLLAQWEKANFLHPRTSKRHLFFVAVFLMLLKQCDDSGKRLLKCQYYGKAFFIIWYFNLYT